MGGASPLRGTLFGLLSPALQDELVAAAHPIDTPAQSWLFREGEPGDTLYLVLSGRLRVVAEREGEQRVLTTLGPGAALGELAVLTDAPRSASVQAVRDSELLELDGEHFAELLRREPELGIGVARALAERLQRGGMLEPAEAPVAVVTLATLPGEPAPRIWSELQAAFAELGDTVAFTEPASEWSDLWTWGRHLGELERAHDYVLLHVSLDDSDWTAFCLRQADRVLLVTGGAPPNVELPAGADVVFAQTPLVDHVAEWSRRVHPRSHHVLDPEALTASTQQLARRLTGRSIGVVLSGGGARAFAHLGVLEVLTAEGVVVDRFGGCSMGAFVAAMAALGWQPEQMLATCRDELARRAPFNDYTFPRYALIRARRAASMLRRIFGDVAVEQLTRPLFTVSADLLSSRMVVHRTGSLVEAVGSSMAIPGLAPPVLRRAELLVDGGVLNNLPVDVMTSGEQGPVIAVDVMRRIETPSDAEVLLPTILETLSRATVLGSVERAESNRELASLLIAPEVQDISLRGFRHLERAVEAGRRAAENALGAGGKETLATSAHGGVTIRVAPPALA
jgi:NTE family protein